jgi:hypothetical protein
MTEARRGLRLRGEGGAFQVAEMMLLVVAVVLPLAIAVLLTPIWLERQSVADLAAQEAARRVVLAGSWGQGTAEGTAMVRQMASNYQLPAGALMVRYSGALRRGATVTAHVTVQMPALRLPFVGSFGRWSLTRSHTEAVDQYRSF